MALQPPSPQSNVVRNDVGGVVDGMLTDSRVKWVAIVYQDTTAGVDRFTITPHVVDPTGGG